VFRSGLVPLGFKAFSHQPLIRRDATLQPSRPVLPRVLIKQPSPVRRELTAASISLIDTILGRTLASNEAGEQRIGSAAGVPTFGLDALSSAAYGPEAALTVLLPLGAAGLTFILPLTVAIVILLGIVYVSYRQTIAAYPNGGGSYTVARENLGANAGLVAAAALMTDYVLNVAVGISAGVGALSSALPTLQPYTLPLCLLILILLTFVNLRGIREAGRLFMLPTCVFILSLCAWRVRQWTCFPANRHLQTIRCWTQKFAVYRLATKEARARLMGLRLPTCTRSLEGHPTNVVN
jgi:hypothetical protein